MMLLNWEQVIVAVERDDNDINTTNETFFSFLIHKFIADAVGGVFVVLGFGCLFALIVAVLEFLWNVKKVAVEQKV